MNLDIQGKVALITGGDSGIGLATAKLLAQEGAKIVLNDIDKADLKQARQKVQELTASKDDVLAIPADLTNNQAVLDMAQQVKEKMGGVDILVNCAGVRGAAGDFLELSDEDWMETIDVDLMSAVRVCRAFIPQMQEKGWGRIVLIASENALQPTKKKALTMLAKQQSSTWESACRVLIVATVCSSTAYRLLT